MIRLWSKLPDMDPKQSSTEYASHQNYMERSKNAADERCEVISELARVAFQPFIRTETCLVIYFQDMSAIELGKILERFPLLAKPLMLLCNVAERAIERDLNIKGIHPYKPKFDARTSAAVAAYIKPFLPRVMEFSAFCSFDRIMFIDKEIRKGKGQWEQAIKHAIVSAATEVGFVAANFSKCHFKSGEDIYELDIALKNGEVIELGIDVKRIEARRDLHKRCDEIINKATKFKTCFPDGKFVAFVYYPFLEEQINIERRLKSEHVDYVVFASEHPESVSNAAKHVIKAVKFNQA